MQISPIFKSGHKHTLTHTHGFLDSVYGLLITSGMENQFLPWSDLFTPWLGPGLGLGLVLGSSLVPDQWELMTSLASDALPPDFYLDRSCLVSRHLQTLALSTFIVCLSHKGINPTKQETACHIYILFSYLYSEMQQTFNKRDKKKSSLTDHWDLMQNDA